MMSFSSNLVFLVYEQAIYFVLACSLPKDTNIVSYSQGIWLQWSFKNRLHISYIFKKYMHVVLMISFSILRQRK